MRVLSCIVCGNGQGEPAATPGERLYRDLQGIAERFQSVPHLRRAMVGTEGPIDGVIRLRTEEGPLNFVVVIRDGEMQVRRDGPPGEEAAGATLIFASEAAIEALERAGPDEGVRQFLATDVRLEGNPAVFAYFSYLMSLVDLRGGLRAIDEQKRENQAAAFDVAAPAARPDRGMRGQRIAARLRAEAPDPGAPLLADPYLADYTLDHFPRLAAFKEAHHRTRPEVTAEFGELLTDFHLAHGYECRKGEHTPWDPALRTAEAFRYVMGRKAPLLREGDLLAGTLTPNPVCGSVNQPYTVGWSIWGELATISQRELDPFDITPQTAETLHRKVFPFWMNRHLQQVWKAGLTEKEGEYPLTARIYDRLFFLVPWGLVSLSPGSPGFATVVKQGLRGLREAIARQRLAYQGDTEKENALAAMAIALEGVAIYARRLAEQVDGEAQAEGLPAERRAELREIARILRKVPEEPAETLHEALQTIWLLFIAIGLDSMDDDLTIGRLDQILQPYFKAEMAALAGEGERAAYVKRAIELVGCLFLRLTSHRLAAATIASWQNSGAPGVASITIGGVDREGKDAVNEMTYIILKVTEMLSLDDPDMDARYLPEVNSDTYLKRVCEVNYITSGTPAIHNDAAVIEALRRNPDWAVEDIRDWVSCGCVEPVITGKHFAATGDLDSSLMVPLEMALDNGRHPVWNRSPLEPPLGPLTGELEGFTDFDAFFEAFRRQFHALYERMIKDLSHPLVAVQQRVMPAPLYSALLEGCIESGRGMTEGGARYNSSGASFIGLSDVVDSLLAIEQLVFDGIDGHRFSFRDLKRAVDHNFHGPIPGDCEDRLYKRIYAAARYRTAKLGSGDPRARAMTRRVTAMVRAFFDRHDNGRGGPYTTGYRTNNNHTVFGRVAGASPSGRLAKTPYTSGLTPSPMASKSLPDNLDDVASIPPDHADNSYTFNVRLSFSKKNSHARNVDLITHYVKSYFGDGSGKGNRGMQIQFNMVDTDTLKDAMANPEHYPDLIVRVSGYTGYYTRMQRDLQLEVIGRTEFAL